MWDEWSHADGQAQRPLARSAAPSPALRRRGPVPLPDVQRAPAVVARPRGDRRVGWRRGRRRDRRRSRRSRSSGALAPGPGARRVRRGFGALVALIAHLLLRALLDGLFGLHLPYEGGAIDGLVLGAAAGIGYALATPQPPGGGLAAPSGRRRLAAASSWAPAAPPQPPPWRCPAAFWSVAWCTRSPGCPGRRTGVGTVGSLHRRARLRPHHARAAQCLRGRRVWLRPYLGPDAPANASRKRNRRSPDHQTAHRMLTSR